MTIFSFSINSNSLGRPLPSSSAVAVIFHFPHHEPPDASLEDDEFVNVVAQNLTVSEDDPCARGGRS